MTIRHVDVTCRNQMILEWRTTKLYDSLPRQSLFETWMKTVTGKRLVWWIFGGSNTFCVSKSKTLVFIVKCVKKTRQFKWYFKSYTLLITQRFSSLKKGTFLVTVQTEDRDVNNRNTFSFGVDAGRGAFFFLGVCGSKMNLVVGSSIWDQG